MVGSRESFKTGGPELKYHTPRFHVLHLTLSLLSLNTHQYPTIVRTRHPLLNGPRQRQRIHEQSSGGGAFCLYGNSFPHSQHFQVTRNLNKATTILFDLSASRSLSHFPLQKRQTPSLLAQTSFHDTLEATSLPGTPSHPCPEARPGTRYFRFIWTRPKFSYLHTQVCIHKRCRILPRYPPLWFSFDPCDAILL